MKRSAARDTHRQPSLRCTDEQPVGRCYSLNVEISELSVSGSFRIDLPSFADERGVFFESFRADRALEAFGRRVPIRQGNVSVSRRGVLRGLHYAEVPLGQAKYVVVLAGRILDYIVDLRVGSPTFGATEVVELAAAMPGAVFLSEGLGHAFLALEDDTVVSYLVTDVFRPEREHGISPLDPVLGLEFPISSGELILSDKDRTAPTLDEAMRSGVLPTWDSCTARYAALAEADPR